MSDELVRRLQHLGDWQAADRIEAQAVEITRLRAELVTARREGMEEAAKMAIARGWRYERLAAAIRAAAGEDREP